MLSRVELETVQVSRLGQSREEGKESQRDELTTPEQPLFWETRTERPEITIPIIIINVRIVQNNSRTFLSLSLTLFSYFYLSFYLYMCTFKCLHYSQASVGPHTSNRHVAHVQF